jgi:hypothetical protein
MISDKKELSGIDNDFEIKRREEERKLSEVLESNKINEKINISLFFKKRNMSAFNLNPILKNEENSSHT